MNTLLKTVADRMSNHAGVHICVNQVVGWFYKNNPIIAKNAADIISGIDDVEYMFVLHMLHSEVYAVVLSDYSVVAKNMETSNQVKSPTLLDLHDSSIWEPLFKEEVESLQEAALRKDAERASLPRNKAELESVLFKS